MVVVHINPLVVSDDAFVIDLSVIGFIPKSTPPGSQHDVMMFITEWAESIAFNYINPSLPELTRKFGFYIAELARGKIRIGDVYENTNDFSGPLYAIYIDRGSPFRHVYFVPHPSRNGRIIEGKVIGVSHVYKHYILVDAYFMTTNTFIMTAEERFVSDDIIEKADDDEIHTFLHPELPHNKLTSCVNIALGIARAKKGQGVRQ